MRGRRSAIGEKPALSRARALLQKGRMLREQHPASAAQADRLAIQPYSFGTGPSWQPLGPAPLVSDPTNNQSYGLVSGRVTAIAVDQSDHSGNTVFVGAAYGGVWKSTNAATSNPANVAWQAVTDDQATLSIGAIAVSPNGQTVLAGTGEPNNSGDSYYGLGILRSTSRGAAGTWSLITSADGGAHPFTGLGFSKIAFSTNNPALVVAAVAHASITDGLPDQTVGLYSSSDGGASWMRSAVTDSGAAVSAGSATDVVFDASNNTFYAALRAHGIYQSTDGGQTWTRAAQQPNPAKMTLTNCPSTVGSLTSCPLYRAALALNGNQLYAFVIGIDNNNGDVDNGIWKSTVSGSPGAWTQMSDTTIASCGDSGGGCGVNQGTYDLYLSAVPDGGSTDLYVGLVNLYKSPRGGALSNVSHVYGCNPVHMHPDYHAQDFSRSNPNIIYFGNDGGVYRTLSGSQIAGGCSTSNLISSLNQNIGSLTQFMSFSQHPTNPAVILGGTQDNGSPGTSNADSSTQWADVNLGDGGFNEIDPSGNIWFTANTDVTIQRCTAGTACNVLKFNNLVNIDSNLGGVNFPDHGDFYTPYILDPANANQIIIGTCRVWRGSSASSGSWSSSSFANALSNQLDASNGNPNVKCGANENFFVSALAAGGPSTASGSKVIYAGMAGGQLANGNSVGGNIWVTTNATAGQATWVDRTGAINPNHFDISSIAIDPADASGQTAYVTIMGFTGGGHVFKTTNAGVSWTDISSGLPDAPADSVVVDPTNRNDIIVGTDVGIFRSLDDGSTWSAFGKFFPNVVVNHLRMFSTPGALKLRASTHGRGVWELDMGFSVTVSNPVVTAFPGQMGTFNASLTGGYPSTVNLSCGAGAPAGCAASPSSFIPSGPFTVNASANTPQDYNFNVIGQGTGSPALNVQKPVTLRVIDYTLTSNVSSPVVAYPNAAVNVPVTLTPQGQFNQAVTLSCSGLPANAACSFSPAATVAVTPNSSVPVTVSVLGVDPVAAGNYNVSVIAATAGAPANKSLNFTLALEDFAVSTTSVDQQVFPSQSAIFNGNVTALNGYGLNVALGCANVQPAALATCSPAPTPITPSAPFMLTVNGGSTIADYSFAMQGKGADPAGNMRQQQLRFRVVDFGLSAPSPATVTVPQGTISQPLNFQIQPSGSFEAPVTLDCSFPAPITGASCAFNGKPGPVTLSAEGAGAPVAMTITTTGTAAVVTSQPFQVNASATLVGFTKAVNLPLSLTVTSSTGTTDMTASDAAPEAATAVHAIGQPMTLTFTVENSGIAVTSANLYVNFSAPVLVESAGTDASCAPVDASGAALTCAIGSMTASDSRQIAITFVPAFGRTIDAIAVVNSELSDSNLADNTLRVSRNLRVRPFARQGLPALLP